MEEREFTGVFIPAKLYLDKNLSWIEKLLIVEIESLKSEKEPCHASNQHFAEHFNLSAKRVSEIINKLVKEGYIFSKIVYEKGTKQIKKRWLLVNHKTYSYFQLEGMEENGDTYPEKYGNPIPKNTEENKVNKNNITPYNPPTGENDIFDTQSLDGGLTDEDHEYNFELVWSDYPRKEGKTKAYSYYRQWIKGRKINGRTVKLIARQMGDAVERYAEKVKYTDPKYIQQGSTFFNSTILDYVDME